MEKDIADLREGFAGETVLAAYRPLVLSVCRRYLRKPEDIMDASQETYLKLIKHVASGHQLTGGWIWTAAYTTCVDFVRRSTAERRKREESVYSAMADAGEMLLREAVRRRVGDALLQLDSSTRELIVARFYRKMPLRQVSQQMGMSVATMSRRTTAGLAALAEVLRDMGIHDIDGPGLAEHFGALGSTTIDAECDGLRFAPDWECVAQLWQTPPRSTGLLPGWSRPIRVGFMISWRTTQMWITTLRAYSTPEEQLLSANSLSHPGLQLVAIAEPGTTHLGLVERTVREHELTGGLVDASCAEELQTLDVIVLGRNFVMDDAVARAIKAAVRSGTGLLNEYWTQHGFGRVHNVDVWELMLSRSPIYCYHSPTFCGSQNTATVRAEDSVLLPGLKTGTSLMVRECGPAYLPSEGTRVILTRDKIVQPNEHGLAGVGELPLPGYMLGQLGNGRVAVVHCWPHQALVPYLSVPAEQYFLNLLAWLATGRIERSAGPGYRESEAINT
jgi:RNA polymerase sigma factor (sigma-70 family)